MAHNEIIMLNVSAVLCLTGLQTAALQAFFLSTVKVQLHRVLDPLIQTGLYSKVG